MRALFEYRSLAQPRWLALTFLGLCLGYAVTTLLVIHRWWIPLIVALWLAMAWLFRWGRPRYPRVRRVLPWSLLPLALWWLYIYLADSFGIVDLGAIFFHLQAGITDHGGAGRVMAAFIYTACGFISLVAFTWLARHDQRWRLWERMLAMLLLATNPLLFGITQRSAAIVAEDGAWLDRRYMEPTVLERPSEPPNLLLIYLESIERTYSDRERFGDAYADLEAVGEGGVVFEGVRQLENTGWTMAGMISSQCGTPLMPAGLLHDRQFEPLEAVVPGVTCMGDLLSEEGYRLSYLGGASKNFAGKGLFYYGHGFDDVYGREELLPHLDDPEYLNSWGLYDDTLFDLVEEEIRALDAQEGPWGLFTLTIGGHAPHGHPATACLERQGEFDGIDILYSVECNAWLTRQLLARLNAQGLLDNTVVVIASDHLTMRVSAWEQLIGAERDNTFILMGSAMPPGRVQRESSMLDLFPTVLEAMGFTINQHRAGLGVSLLSSVQTLVERHGEVQINAKLHAERALQQRLWDGLAPQHQGDGEVLEETSE
ncbi:MULTISPECIES: sulfatase-like hydrolase/transferase [Halomonadaceae]|uniref:sulfatase-like hydrolase/transferase n=1 Tax=Halomonadaceae TaxID=28256 RepID=UPI001598DB24|nr:MULTISPECIES: sulfatase-like hydrolase/transferase [Halomonas]QJQ95580.1 sulfatase-like hydrolase/transferase [Halomonas sp. PA5]